MRQDYPGYRIRNVHFDILKNTFKLESISLLCMMNLEHLCQCVDFPFPMAVQKYHCHAPRVVFADLH